MRELTPREKFIVGGAAGAAVLAFFPWISVSFGGGEMGEMFKQLGGASGGGSGGNGFSTFEGVLAFLAALGTGGLVLADRAGVLPWPARTRLLAPLASAGLALLCLLIFFGRAGGVSNPMVSVGRSFWFYVALLAMGFAAFHAYHRFSEGGKASDTPAAPSSPPPPVSPPPPAVP